MIDTIVCSLRIMMGSMPMGGFFNLILFQKRISQSSFLAMYYWKVMLFYIPAVFGAHRLRELQKNQWCSYFNTYRVVFTNNRWNHCPRAKLEDENHLGLFKNNLQILRVAVVQDMIDFRHDCWATADKNGDIILEDSYSSFILKILQDVLKFKFITVSGNNSIYNTTAKSRDMLVQLLIRNQADIGVCHLTVTPSRVNGIGFLHSTIVSSRALVFDPSHLSLLEDVFVLTFSATLWICFFVAIALLIMTFRFSTWMHSLVRPDHENWSWFEVILWAVAAVCQQSFGNFLCNEMCEFLDFISGYSRHPKGLSCRTTFIIGYVITYLLYTGFAAGVTSLLAVQGRDVKLTLDDVLSMKLTLVTTAHTTHHAFIKSLGSQTTHFEKRIQTKVVANHDELFKYLDIDNTIGFGSTINLENYVRERIPISQRKHYMISVLPKTRTQESLIVQKNSPYKEAFNYWLLRMQEVGILSLGQDRYLKVAQENCNDLPGWSSASLRNVLSAVLILCGGYFFSVLILFCEMAWMRKKTSTEWELRTKSDILHQYRHFRHQAPSRTV